MSLRPSLTPSAPTARDRKRVPEPFRLFDWLMHPADGELRNTPPAGATRPRAGSPSQPGREARRLSDDGAGPPGFQFRGIL